MTHFFERYREQLRASTQAGMQLMESPLELVATQLSMQLALAGLEISQKYLFTPSAAAFHKELLDQRLLATTEDTPWKMKLPELPVWIEMEGSLIDAWVQARGLLINNFYHPEVVKRVKHPMLSHSPFKERLTGMDEWYCDVIGLEGLPVFSFGMSKTTGDPYVTSGHTCPWDQCTFPDVCHECQAQMVFWALWLVIAQLMVEGNFATTPELTTYPEHVEVLRHREKSKKNPKKKVTTLERLVYHVVTFDACLKKAPAGNNPEREREREHSWVEESLSIDPDAIIYLDRQIAPFSRTLRHPRFIHKQGQTIEVRGHEKRIPVKVRDLGHKITRIVASKYEQE